MQPRKLSGHSVFSGEHLREAGGPGLNIQLIKEIPQCRKPLLMRKKRLEKCIHNTVIILLNFAKDFGIGGGRKLCLGGQSINIARAKFLGHAPLFEVQGSRVLQTVQLLSTPKMDGKRAQRSLLEPTLGSR